MVGVAIIATCTVLFNITYRTVNLSERTAASCENVTRSENCSCENGTPVTPQGSHPTTWQARLQSVRLGEIFMDASEVSVILWYLQNTQLYLEYGSGGSTLNFAIYAGRKAYSIEHDKAWCDRMGSKLESRSINNVEMRCVYVPKYNMGFSDGTYLDFKDYVNTIDDIGETTFDFVLVDGRARIAAAVKVLSYIHNNSVVVLHDANRIFDERIQDRYEEVWDYYDPVVQLWGPSVRGLVVLKRKASLHYLQENHEAVQNILDTNYSQPVSSYREGRVA